jgi:glutamate-1-semialdehyde aminotransferase
VLPDLTVMGKIVGGGLPAAAYGGPRRLMELISPAGDVYQAGTLSGNPLAMAAGLATLAKLDHAAYERLGETTGKLADGLAGAAEAAGVEVSVVSETGLLTVFFAPTPPSEYEAAKQCNLEAHAASCLRAGSTPRRHSSRRGSHRSCTTTPRLSARSKLPPAPLRRFRGSVDRDDETVRRVAGRNFDR